MSLNGENNQEELDDIDSMFPSSDSLEKDMFFENDIEKQDKKQPETIDLAKELEDFTTDTEDNEGKHIDGTPSLEGDSSLSLVSPLALSLREKGILQSFTEDEIKEFKDVDQLLDAIVADRDKHLKHNLNETQLKYLEALEKGIPEDEIKQDLTAEDAYSSLTDEDVVAEPKLQQQLVYNDLISKGVDKDKAIRTVNSFAKAGTLEEEAKDSLKTLQKSSKEVLAQKILNAKEKESKDLELKQKEVADLKSSILSADEIIKGYKLNDTLKTKVFDSMTKVVEVEGKRPLNIIESERKKNPIEFDKKLHLTWHLTDGFTNFQNINDKQKTSAVNDLKSKLERGGSLGKGAKVPISSDTQEFLSELRKGFKD
jgi:hypothetical protein